MTRSLFWIRTGTSIKRGGIKLDIWAQIFPLSEMMRPCKFIITYSSSLKTKKISHCRNNSGSNRKTVLPFKPKNKIGTIPNPIKASFYPSSLKTRTKISHCLNSSRSHRKIVDTETEEKSIPRLIVIV